MPIYEYVCEKCGNQLEVMQKMSDKPLTRCPKCRGKLEKIFSQTSFQLKGSGWYVSDYANKSKTSTPEKGEKTEKAEKSDATTTTESTATAEPAAKAEKPEKAEKPAKKGKNNSGASAT